MRNNFISTWSTAVEELTTALAALYPPEESKAIARRTVMHFTGANFTKLMLEGKDTVLQAKQTQQIKQAQDKLLQGEPLQYVLGEAEFGPVTLQVDHGVLIPRPETEELCALIAQRHVHTDPLQILDVGTGSGAIAAYLAYYFRAGTVYAWEKSHEAIAIARINFDILSKQHQIPRPILIEGDFLQPECWPAEPRELDLLVSNPPYIPQKEATTLAPHVRWHEPELALFVPNEDPLRYYKMLAQYAPTKKPSNRPLSLYCETHHLQAYEVAKLFASDASQTEVLKDFNGHNRFVIAQYE